MIGAKITINWKTLAAVGGLAVALVAYQRFMMWEVKEKVIPAVDPSNAENIFNSAVNRAGETATGQDGWTLGGQVWDWTHDENGEPGPVGRVLDKITGVSQ